MECNGQVSACAARGENGTGVADSDFIFYVSARDEDPCGGNVLAFAGGCAMEQTLDRWALTSTTKCTVL